MNNKIAHIVALVTLALPGLAAGLVAYNGQPRPISAYVSAPVPLPEARVEIGQIEYKTEVSAPVAAPVAPKAARNKVAPRPARKAAPSKVVCYTQKIEIYGGTVRVCEPARTQTGKIGLFARSAGQI
jgi:hypothetical protein